MKAFVKKIINLLPAVITLLPFALSIYFIAINFDNAMERDNVECYIFYISGFFNAFLFIKATDLLAKG